MNPNPVVLMSVLRKSVAPLALLLLAAPLAAQRPTTPADAGRLIGALSHDSLAGRMTGTAGAEQAARMIAGEMRRMGLVPASPEGLLQRVPIVMMPGRQPGAAMRPALAPSMAALDTVPAERRRVSSNVIGMIPGTDPVMKDEVVIVGAHYDHIGTSGARAVDGDSIFNGADDDASGVAAMLEAARQLREGAPPKRTILFIAFTGEENGMTGTRWYLANPVRPLAQTVADLQIEMIGREDSLAGGAGKGWLTGYERSTMGEVLAAKGVPLIADPRPSQNFFSRSDNYPFALEGIPAHTISSFGGHTDYHGVNDEVEKMDLAHVASVINATARAVRVLADGERITWKENGKPVRRP